MALNVTHEDAAQKSTSGTTGTISFTTQDIAGDLCLDNNGDYHFLTVSLDYNVEISEAQIDSLAATVVTKLQEVATQFSGLVFGVETIKEGLSSTLERGINGNVSVTFTWLSGKLLHARGFVSSTRDVASTATGHGQVHANSKRAGRRSSANRNLSGDSSTVAGMEASATIPIFEVMGPGTDAYLKQTYMRNRIGGTYIDESGNMTRRDWWQAFLDNRESEIQRIFVNTSSERGLAALESDNNDAFTRKYSSWIEAKEREWHNEVLARQDVGVMGDATEISNAFQRAAPGRERAEAYNRYHSLPREHQAKVLIILKGLGVPGLSMPSRRASRARARPLCQALRSRRP